MYQARRRTRISLGSNAAATLAPSCRRKLTAVNFIPVFIRDFVDTNPDQNVTRHTLERRGLSSGSRSTVAEHEVKTSPLMRIGNFNVAGIARSNFEPGVNIDESIAISNNIATTDVVNVCDGVNVSVVALRGVRGKRLQASASTRSPHACRAHHNVQG